MDLAEQLDEDESREWRGRPQAMKALSPDTRKWLDALASGLDLADEDDRAILRERVTYATRATRVETVNGWLGKKFPDRDTAVCALVSRYLGISFPARKS